MGETGVRNTNFCGFFSHLKFGWFVPKNGSRRGETKAGSALKILNFLNHSVHYTRYCALQLMWNVFYSPRKSRSK